MAARMRAVCGATGKTKIRLACSPWQTTAPAGGLGGEERQHRLTTAVAGTESCDVAAPAGAALDCRSSGGCSWRGGLLGSLGSAGNSRAARHEGASLTEVTVASSATVAAASRSRQLDALTSLQQHGITSLSASQAKTADVSGTGAWSPADKPVPHQRETQQQQQQQPGTEKAASTSSSHSPPLDPPPSFDLNRLFNDSPQPLGVGPNPKVVLSPPSSAFGLLLRLLGYFSKESERIRGANELYRQLAARADDEKFLAAFGLPKTFRTTHAMLILHLWLCLVRLRAEGKDGAEIGQTMYEVFNHDCEQRVVATGVGVLISRWMRELEKNFYGAVTAYDEAMKPTAAADALPRALWRNVFAEDASEMPAGADLVPVQALAQYLRIQTASLAMTGSDAFMSGNIKFGGPF